MATILVVDDELGIRALLSEILTDEGHTVELAENAAQARALREDIRPDLVLLDIWMPDVDGVTLLKEWNAAGQLTMPVIMMSGHGTIDTAVEATKFGAQAFLEKPITLQKLLRAVEQALVKPPGAPARAAQAQPAGMPLPAVHPAAYAATHLAPQAGLAGGHARPLAGLNGLTVDGAALPASNALAHNHAALGPQNEQSFELDRPLREARDAFEKAYFEFHLARENGSMTRVAEKTGLERTHLYRKLKQLGVDLTRNKRSGGL
ncbi:MAG: response regulator [Pseudomonadota bacterium]